MEQAINILRSCASSITANNCYWSWHLCAMQRIPDQRKKSECNYLAKTKWWYYHYIKQANEKWQKYKNKNYGSLFDATFVRRRNVLSAAILYLTASTARTLNCWTIRNNWIAYLTGKSQMECLKGWRTIRNATWHINYCDEFVIPHRDAQVHKDSCLH